MSWSAVISHRFGEFHLDVTLDGDADLVAVVGPNGSGKTSVLRTIAGAVKPDSGQISIGGCVVLSTDSGVNLAPEDRAVGYVPQGFGLFQHLNVLHNVGFGLSTWRRPLPNKEKSERAFEALVQLGAEHLADRSPRSLSGGEQQRVALARALVINPEILLLDEPFSTLDPVSRGEVRGVLSERLSSLGIPTILVTHRADDVAALGAKLCVMREGRVIQSGTIDEVLASPADAFVEAFLATLRPS